HRHLVQPKEPGSFRLLRWAVAFSALAVLLAIMPQIFRKGAMPPTLFEREDVNHDGKVDILDAFAVARQVRQGAIHNAHLDINGDGIVDDRDVAAIASRAVNLSRGGHS